MRVLVLVETKTARSRRVVNLPDMCVDALRLHRVRQIQDKLLAGSLWAETGFVFTTGIGTPLDVETVGRRLRRLLVAAACHRYDSTTCGTAPRASSLRRVSPLASSWMCSGILRSESP